MFKKEAF